MSTRLMSKKKILIIEDDKDLSDLYRIYLERENFVVLSSANGMEGVAKSIDKSVDLILLDLMMPDSDGRDVLSMLSLHNKTKDIPIIILSNLNPDTYDLSEYDGQVIDYWVKSDITPKILVEKLLSYFS